MIVQIGRHNQIMPSKIFCASCISLAEKSTQLYIHIVVRIVYYEFLICSAALLSGLSNGVIQGATENTRTDQRERNTVQSVVHQ